VLLQRDYPSPIVQLEGAMRQARQRLSDWKQQQQRSEWRAEQQQIINRHASRKRPQAKGKASSVATTQLSIFSED